MAVRIKWAVRIVPGSWLVLALAGTQGVWLLLVELVMEVFLLIRSEHNKCSAQCVCLYDCVSRGLIHKHLATQEYSVLARDTFSMSR